MLSQNREELLLQVALHVNLSCFENNIPGIHQNGSSKNVLSSSSLLGFWRIALRYGELWKEFRCNRTWKKAFLPSFIEIIIWFDTICWVWKKVLHTRLDKWHDEKHGKAIDFSQCWLKRNMIAQTSTDRKNNLGSEKWHHCLEFSSICRPTKNDRVKFEL